jgi:signal transduction histidine kinase
MQGWLRVMQNIRLVGKITIPVSVMAIITLGIIVFAGRSLNSLAEQTREIIDVTAARQTHSLQSAVAMDGVSAAERDALLATDQPLLDYVASSFVQDMDRLRANIVKLKALARSRAETEAIERIEGALERYAAAAERIYWYLVYGDVEAARALSSGEAQEARLLAARSIHDLVDQSAEMLNAAKASANALYNRTMIWLILVSGSGLFAALALLWWMMSRLVTRPLAAIAGAMGRISEGDLSAEILEVERHDEMGVLVHALRIFKERTILANALTEQLHAHVAELEAAKHQLERTASNLETALMESAAGSQAKSQFLATMSHELRTPLNAIIGFADVLANQRFGPLDNGRYEGYAAMIQQSGEHLLELINEVLDFSKLDAGRLELVEEQVDLSEVIRQSRQMISGRAEEAGVSLHTDIPPDVPWLWGDQRRIRQILLNLLSNAVKFTPRGGQVIISVVRTGSGLAASVADTGIGIDPKDIPVALEPFRQIDSSFARKHAGTGLGLPLSKRLAELHGATFHLDSRLGVGTTVTVLFPISREIRESPPASSTAA